MTDRVRYVPESEFVGAPADVTREIHVSDGGGFLSTPIITWQEWELRATFDRRPVAVLAIMQDGTIYRLDLNPSTQVIPE